MSKYSNRRPGKVTRYDVYVDGGTDMLGLAETTLPSFEALSDTLKGAGLPGEIDLPSAGRFGAMVLGMAFQMLYGDTLDLAVGETHRFDLRAQIEYVDKKTLEIRTTPERWQVVGPIKKIDPGKRVAGGFADATMDVSVFSVKHYLDGEEKLEYNAFDPDGYTVNGKKIISSMED